MLLECPDSSKRQKKENLLVTYTQTPKRYMNHSGEVQKYQVSPLI